MEMQIRFLVSMNNVITVNLPGKCIVIIVIELIVANACTYNYEFIISSAST